MNYSSSSASIAPPRAVMLRGPTLTSRTYFVGLPSTLQELVAKGSELFPVPPGKIAHITLGLDERAIVLQDSYDFIRDREVLHFRWTTDTAKRSLTNRVRWDEVTSVAATVPEGLKAPVPTSPTLSKQLVTTTKANTIANRDPNSQFGEGLAARKAHAQRVLAQQNKRKNEERHMADNLSTNPDAYVAEVTPVPIDEHARISPPVSVEADFTEPNLQEAQAASHAPTPMLEDTSNVSVTSAASPSIVSEKPAAVVSVQIIESPPRKKRAEQVDLDTPPSSGGKSSVDRVVIPDMPLLLHDDVTSSPIRSPTRDIHRQRDDVHAAFRTSVDRFEAPAYAPESARKNVDIDVYASEKRPCPASKTLDHAFATTANSMTTKKTMPTSSTQLPRSKPEFLYKRNASYDGAIGSPAAVSMVGTPKRPLVQPLTSEAFERALRAPSTTPQADRTKQRQDVVAPFITRSVIEPIVQRQPTKPVYPDSSAPVATPAPTVTTPTRKRNLEQEADAETRSPSPPHSPSPTKRATTGPLPSLGTSSTVGAGVSPSESSTVPPSVLDLITSEKPVASKSPVKTNKVKKVKLSKKAKAEARLTSSEPVPVASPPMVAVPEVAASEVELPVKASKKSKGKQNAVIAAAKPLKKSVKTPAKVGQEPVQKQKKTKSTAAPKVKSGRGPGRPRKIVAPVVVDEAVPTQVSAVILTPRKSMAARAPSVPRSLRSSSLAAETAPTTAPVSAPDGASEHLTLSKELLELGQRRSTRHRIPTHLD